MSFGADVETREWQRAVAALGVRFMRNTSQAIQQSEWLVERQVKRYLNTYTHREGTPTPSPPGGPPALVSGNLRRSWRNIPPHPGRRPFTWEGGGGPTAVYSRIHELGGTIIRTRLPRQDLSKAAGSVTAGQTRKGAGIYRIHIPKRPYVRPMVLVLRRGIRRIHVDLWTQAIREI